jgi:hypothetical protein
MEEKLSIEVLFSPEEKIFHELVLKHCADKKTAAGDYIKELIKKDLAWGRFPKRKTPKELKKE